jgi:L-ascorbate metabolism protein UlaG (beta-lactamase superfamily)
MSLTWFGQSTFVLSTSTGLKALLDPMGPGTGYAIAPVTGVDLVTVSHEHSDHNNVGLAAGSPLVLRGLAGEDWARIDQTVKGVRVRTAPTYHDDTQGSQRGKNAVFVFELAGLRLAHLGDLGHTLTPEQVKAIGPVDVVLIPTGGFFTIDGRAAAEVVGQLNPRVIVPMHYKTPDLSQSLAGRLASVETFTAAMAAATTVSEAGQTITLDGSKLPTGQVVMVMKYK